MKQVFNKKLAVGIGAVLVGLVALTLIVFVTVGAFVMTNTDLRNQAIDTLQGQAVTVQALPKE